MIVIDREREIDREENKEMEQGKIHKIYITNDKHTNTRTKKSCGDSHTRQIDTFLLYIDILYRSSKKAIEHENK